MEFPAELGDKYEVQGVLGQGGMGVVYRCIQKVIDRPVAVKVLHAEQLSNEFIERFKQEARLASQLLHTNVVVVFDFGFVKRAPYIAFELVEGPSVRELLKKGIPPPELALDIISQACDGLTAAHAKGIVHRDLKPENLLIAKDGTLKIADFGIAKDQGREGLTQTGVLMGTPSYMSPEQGRDSKVGPGTDIYSLGIVLYELISGRVPFRGQGVLETLRMHAEQPVPPLPQAHPALRTLVSKALAKMPQDRFRSAAAFREELDHVAQMLGHESTIRHHTMTRSFAADGEHGPAGTMVSSVDLSAAAEALQRARREVTPVAPIMGGPLTGVLRRTEPEGAGLAPFLLILAVLGLGGAYVLHRPPGATLVDANTPHDTVARGFGRVMRLGGIGAISYNRRADRVRTDVLQPINVSRDAEVAKLVDAFRAQEPDATTAHFAAALGLVLSGLEESARTEFNSGASGIAPDGQLPAAWLVMNAAVELLALHHVELAIGASAAAEEQEGRRGSPLKLLLHGATLLKRGNPDQAARAFIEYGSFAIGHPAPDGAWDRHGVIDPADASAAWFWAGLAQVLAADKAPEPAAALHNAGGSLARYLTGLPELPCAAPARALLTQLDASGLAPRGLTYKAGSEPAPFGPVTQRLILSARAVIERVTGKRAR